jgi:preprotein translocase subunit SecA
MITSLARKIFGTKNERDINRLKPWLAQINSLEAGVRQLSDTALAGKTSEFKQRLAKGETLDALLPEAFAVVREASVRSLGMRPFDVQMIGGIILHQGKIAEMKTGEGKTLVATMPVYLNALSGRGVHVVTVNDYLAKRDAAWMGKLYNFLGLTVGTIVHELNDRQRQQAYAADVTYGTNNEYGFDYLRDNMKFRIEDYVQRPLHYAIVDEVDSILIDEARTPLIISGPTEQSTDKYYTIDEVVRHLKAEEHFTVDEKARSTHLTDNGVIKLEQLLHIDNLYDPRQIETLHHVNQALKAHALFRIDRDYVVKEGEVLIVDEFTGRLMPGRRYSDGLHQALEAKERVKIENENQTLATITFQNYFRMFEKLAGMTGTADTEAEEFSKIYNLEVSVIPTNKPMTRIDYEDLVYKNEEAKFRAVISEIKEMHELGRPVLVGTVSIEKSELLSKQLKISGIPHTVLNAKYHEKEAEIIKDAGQEGIVTIATNMAGRGTDIVLGAGVAEKGGLHIIGTERHESRRIDNQLRGRSGRQGDLGSSRFFLSLKDDLMRIFASERVAGYMDRLGMEEDVPIEHKWVSKAIEGAQKRVEGRNFDIRKHLLKYDDVMNQQRKIIYTMRRLILTHENIHEMILDDIHELIHGAIDSCCNDEQAHKEWDLLRLAESFLQYFDLHFSNDLHEFSDALAQTSTLKTAVFDHVVKYYEAKYLQIGAEIMRHLEHEIKLRTIDALWKDHLLSMDHLKEGVGFEGYAQQDPLLIYQKRAFELFTDLVYRMKEGTVERLFRIQLAPAAEVERQEILQERQKEKLVLSHGQAQQTPKTVKREGEKVGRNDPCPCGSGKKYKKCHGIHE